jgi:hypothetical protein
MGGKGQESHPSQRKPTQKLEHGAADIKQKQKAVLPEPLNGSRGTAFAKQNKPGEAVRKGHQAHCGVDRLL